ncbi:MAG TPA: ABC transporter ATP-binding protein [Candidatus Saccharimonadales bacterium]|nr:ABC transporter ATP-binding protein [Candidatus Saccharimonadales bacterium]
MSNEIAIRVENVSKTFKLPHEKVTSIKSAVINFYKRKRSFEKQIALKDVSFEVKKGEFFGIVGRNGSGKSTLLKMLAGIYSPSRGSIHINGKLTPFIELGVGFNMELTGRENVFLNGALLGFSRKEMSAMYDDIVDFAELERFMDQKLKNYSSGMQVRLAFSIAIRAKSDILLIDEVLAVGDAAFQQKCYEFFADMRRTGKTIVLVTHDMNAVFRFCDKALLINDGVVMQIDEPKKVADAYLELNYDESTQGASGATVRADEKSPTITSVEVLKDKKPVKNLESGTSVDIKLHFNNPEKQATHFGLQIFNEAGTYCFGTNTSVQGIAPTQAKKGVKAMTVTLDLVPGTYSLTVATMSENAGTVLEYKPNAGNFRIKKSSEVEGVANLKYEWKEGTDV